jgi:hypothetical protein
VELVPDGTLPRFEMKAKLIRELYKGEYNMQGNIDIKFK